jgi:hypothetical protein
MANIQIGKYKRPGIFIEEFNQSVITSPTVEGITNLVIGVSKKGPVNTPVRLTNTGDLEAIFGQLDRNLERKGSFFHRTISKMLETSPVFAINLLLTDDNLDLIEYKSLSASSDLVNDIKRVGPYRRFFDTTGFWKRDSDSFINLTKNNEGYDNYAFSFTNLSDRPISVFVVKSTLSGFDRTILEWYGSEDKMPTYLNSQDYASDYMVDVVVVAGDWSNYQELSVDPRWSRYFNTSGLIKSQIRNFANDRNVNLLSYYEGLSLIPYFRDLNGRNIFIENVINNDTDKTGLFCAFNNDLIETDYYNGKLDLLGNTIVGKNETEIDFLSYKENISEEIEFTATPLDLPGNVTAMFGNYGFYNQDDHTFGEVQSVTGIVENPSSRTGWFAEGVVTGVSGTMSTTPISVTVTYQVSTGAYAVMGNKYVEILPTSSFTINASAYSSVNTDDTFYSAFVLKETGEIKMVTSLVADSRPVVIQSDIVLGYLSFSLSYNHDIVDANLIPVSVSNDSIYPFIDLVSGIDYTINHIANGSIKVEFLGTNGPVVVNDYEKFRKIKAFNRLVSIIDNTNKDKVVMNLGPDHDYKKVSLSNVTITNIIKSETQNKSFILNTGLDISELSDVINEGYLVFYTVDNEFIMGSDGAVTKQEVANSTHGVVSKFSKLYSRFFDGIINTRDFFYDNRLYLNSVGDTNGLNGESVDVEFYKETENPNYLGNYIIFKSTSNFDNVELSTFNQLIFPDSNLNKGTYTIGVSSLNASDLANYLGFDSDSYAYTVNESVVNEKLTNITRVYDVVSKNYLKMYIENGSNLVLETTDDLLSSKPINNIANNTFYVQSRKSNLKQTIEIETIPNYTQSPNKILANGARYTEVKVGDFLEAYYDVDSLEVGQVPRKLTRILNKRQYAGDTSLVEITCDAEIKKYTYGQDLQTMRYASIDNYVSTYKAITLNGFKVRQASLPDGTEAKQNQILNLVAKGTPLFKALTNKEAFDFRYLIDTFGLGLIERSKQQLVDIVGSRLDAFAFINMPSLKQFKNSSSPSFVDEESVLKVEYIAQGGNPESNPAFLYSFGDGNGTSCSGYFTPYVGVNDNGRAIEIPPASYVATTYMRKHISNVTSVTPWTIAAGVTNGRITGITGLEMDFGPEDIEFLNQAQMNPIVFKRNRGYVIETENTSETLFTSSLSFIHSREVLIELERELSRMLLDYQWKFNTPDVRAEIKLKADVICETFVNRNGLFNYFNKMDDENNTVDIIDNQIGVLDTYVEIIKGMGIIVNNITILRTGAIQVGGFINP